MKHPCTQTCPERDPFCRIHCQKFREYAAAKEAEREAKRKDSLIGDYITRAVWKNRRMVRKGKRRQP